MNTPKTTVHSTVPRLMHTPHLARQRPPERPGSAPSSSCAVSCLSATWVGVREQDEAVVDLLHHLGCRPEAAPEAAQAGQGRAVCARVPCPVRPPAPTPGRQGRGPACSRTMPARVSRQKLTCGPHGVDKARQEAGDFRPILTSARQRTLGRTQVLDSRQKRHVASLGNPTANAAGLVAIAGRGVE